MSLLCHALGFVWEFLGEGRGGVWRVRTEKYKEKQRSSFSQLFDGYHPIRKITKQQLFTIGIADSYQSPSHKILPLVNQYSDIAPHNPIHSFTGILFFYIDHHIKPETFVPKSQICR